MIWATRDLRSARAVAGYEIRCADGSTLGHVTDFFVHDQSWAVCLLVVQTGHWYAGKEIIIPSAKVKSINYPDATVSVSLDEGGDPRRAGVARATVGV